eukprot:1394438-Amorphochlora_amoeboformis.AAC.2
MLERVLRCRSGRLRALATSLDLGFDLGLGAIVQLSDLSTPTLLAPETPFRPGLKPATPAPKLSFAKPLFRVFPVDPVDSPVLSPFLSPFLSPVVPLVVPLVVALVVALVVPPVVALVVPPVVPPDVPPAAPLPSTMSFFSLELGDGATRRLLADAELRSEGLGEN